VLADTAIASKVPVELISIERQNLKIIATTDASPAPYVKTLANVNDNMASHGNNALTES
jgi:hypothetical protein